MTMMITFGQKIPPGVDRRTLEDLTAGAVLESMELMDSIDSDTWKLFDAMIHGCFELITTPSGGTSLMSALYPCALFFVGDFAESTKFDSMIRNLNYHFTAYVNGEAVNISIE